MPELPEVETTKRGLEPVMVGTQVVDVALHNSQLRWPVDWEQLAKTKGQTLLSIDRRSKYLLFNFDSGTWLVHLGMSGSLRLVAPDTGTRKHDHVVLSLSNNLELRYHDPRRFGSWLWAGNTPMDHPRLSNLGPEPLSSQFSGRFLHHATRSRKTPIKNLIMDAKVVVGVGNIYASESLFDAKIHPKKSSESLTLEECANLTKAIKKILRRSIKAGGTTLKDFSGSNGEPGYFQQSLSVYNQEGESCKACCTLIQKATLGQRSTFWCPTCQT